MLIAQITDAHFGAPGETFFGGYEPVPAVGAVVAALNAFRPRPDLVLFTGDLTEVPSPAAYGLAREVLGRLELPMAAIPGNHDDRRLFRETFAALGARVGDSEFLQLVVEAGPVLLVGLDTVEDALAPGGRLCERRLEWTAARLDEAAGRPVIIFMHHPPFDTGIVEMDRIGCDGGAALARIVARHGAVRRVLCGHVHRAVHRDWAGTTASICPGIAWQVALDLRADGGIRHAPGPPAFQLHRIEADGRVLTHTVQLP